MADATLFHRATPSWLCMPGRSVAALCVCGCAATASGCAWRPGRTVAMACGDSQPLIGIQAAYMQSAPLSRRPRFGKVVNIGSNLVYNPVVTYYDYTAAKAALVGLTRNLAAELGPSRTCRKGT